MAQKPDQQQNAGEGEKRLVAGDGGDSGQPRTRGGVFKVEQIKLESRHQKNGRQVDQVLQPGHPAEDTLALGEDQTHVQHGRRHERDDQVVQVGQEIGGLDLHTGNDIDAQKKAHDEEHPAGTRVGLQEVGGRPDEEDGGPANKGQDEDQEHVLDRVGDGPNLDFACLPLGLDDVVQRTAHRQSVRYTHHLRAGSNRPAVDGDNPVHQLEIGLGAGPLDIPHGALVGEIIDQEARKGFVEHPDRTGKRNDTHHQHDAAQPAEQEGGPFKRFNGFGRRHADLSLGGERLHSWMRSK